MPPLFYRNGLLIIAGAAMHILALTFGWFYLAWVCLVPVFIVTQNIREKKTFFYAGAWYGFFFGCLALFWLPLTVLSLAQGTVAKAVLAGILGLGVYVLFYGVVIWTFSLLKKKTGGIAVNALLMAAIWTCGDFLLSSVSDGMPWFSLGISNTLLGNLYAVQPAEYGGMLLMGFLVVAVNYLLAYYYVTKQWKKMVIPVGVVTLYIVAGYLILYNFRQRWTASGAPVSVALISSNIPNTEPWNAENGNDLINGLLKLNEQALYTRPDLVLWPEAIVPWTYRPEDDFVKAILKGTTLLPATCHIMGMNTFVTQNELYNSAYCFSQDGSVAGRYDKHYLVSLAEKPIRLLSRLLLRTGQEVYYRPGESEKTIPFSQHKIGVLICNEVFVPAAARAAVKEGAEFLVSLASDALVASSISVINQQFFRSRLRAVETRKDIAVTCNMGISGMIAATGEVLYADRQNEGATHTVWLTPNKVAPSSYNLTMPTLYFSAIVILIFYFLIFKTTKT